MPLAVDVTRKEGDVLSKVFNIEEWTVELIGLLGLLVFVESKTVVGVDVLCLGEDSPTDEVTELVKIPEVSFSIVDVETESV